MYINEQQYSNFLTDKEITWMGIDFSLAQFTQKSFNLPKDALIYYFNDWNLLIISDHKKYNIRTSFRKPVMHFNLSLISRKNRQIKPQMIKESIEASALLSTQKIISYVQTLAFPTISLYALLFVAESFDEVSKTASVWVVIANTHTRETVLCERFIKNPGGVGIKNYWARIFYNIFLDVNNHSFVRWANLVKGGSQVLSI
ncbi:MAG: hypothetical protein LBL18_05980 [Bacteroidales bacterium]|jgi:hypothetical protein|nr:hypothetical protein [Bacteroidales bacterium]